MPDGAAVVERVVGVAANLSLLGPSIRINDPVIPITASDEYENTFSVPVLSELKAVRQLELARAARRHAKQVHRIVFQKIALAQFI